MDDISTSIRAVVYRSEAFNALDKLKTLMDAIGKIFAALVNEIKALS